MAREATRLLLLGAVALFEPVNGYQIRRELLSWRVDDWAAINPGSIYHGLGSLARDGLLTRHDLTEGQRDVAVYATTEKGRRDLHAMVLAALETTDVHDRVPFQLAFGFLPLMERPDVLAALRRRRTALTAAIDGFAEGVEDPANGPPHARRGWRLWQVLAEAELGWLDEVIDDVASGELRFAPGEDWGWTPPIEDPGHQMSADRERYRAVLAERPGKPS